VADQEGIEAIKARLSNIRSVEPILGAMRTISLGSWQSALKRKARVLSYADRLLTLLPALIPHLDRRRAWRWQRGTTTSAPVAVVVIGSERGLCGSFNSTLVRYVEEELDRFAAKSQVELHTLGARVTRALQRLDYEIASSRSLPMAALPTSDLAIEWTRNWLARYEAREIDAVHLIYNTYRHSALYQPIAVRLIPPPVPSSREDSASGSPPYVDTDPMALLVRVIVLWTSTELYRILLDSASAEHSARYQLMEGATQNSSRLIDELTLALQVARQEAITAEMLELASGAGLIGG
jgi:F-type H+-transporting ATPase subunit gamma